MVGVLSDTLFDDVGVMSGDNEIDLNVIAVDDVGSHGVAVIVMLSPNFGRRGAMPDCDSVGSRALGHRDRRELLPIAQARLDCGDHLSANHGRLLVVGSRQGVRAVGALYPASRALKLTEPFESLAVGVGQGFQLDSHNRWLRTKGSGQDIKKRAGASAPGSSAPTLGQC